MAWGFLSRLFGQPARKETPIEQMPEIIRLTKGGFFDVVGEAQFQGALEAICGGKDVFSAKHQCQAILIPEPNNPVDPNAVQVVIERKVVAYLSPHHAAEYHQHIGMRASSCDAKIVGGWDDGDTVGYFGVKLKIKWPPKERKSARR